MRVIKKPDLSNLIFRSKLANGIGHNYYGEPAWPNDLPYIFPIVILRTLTCVISLSVLDPISVREFANPFATPLEILPEWYFYPTFQILRTIPNKLFGVILITIVPIGLLTIPTIEKLNKFQNPLRRPIALIFFFIGIFITIWFRIGATFSINTSIILELLSDQKKF